MKRFAIAFVLVLSLFALIGSAKTKGSAKGKGKEWTGYVSDSKCGLKGENADHASCAQKCVDGGAAPVFVSSGKVYKIANTDKVKDHVGHKVTVKGKVKGDTLTISDLQMAS